MSAKILDGKSLALEIQQELREQTEAFTQSRGVRPTLAAVLVGVDPASEVYVRNKRRACERVGINSQLRRLPEEAAQETLLALIQDLNADPAVHGILVQLPLPPHLQTEQILDEVNPLKDVDAFHPHNVGLLSQGRPRFLPCTPHGVVRLLHHNQIEVAGKHVVIIGRSDIVGKPLALMLAQKDSTRPPYSKTWPAAANATVTICHSRSRDLEEIARSADVLIAAVGKAKLVSSSMVKPGAVVVDVGINRTPQGLCGDVDFEAVKEVASALTPVPGGVGPLTVAMLLHNTLAAAKSFSAIGPTP